MKTKFTRLIAVLCALLMMAGTLTVLSGCKTTEKPPVTETDTTTDVDLGDIVAPPEGEEGEKDQSERARYLPVRQDLNNYKYRMLVDGGINMSYFGPQEGLKGDAVDIAFYNRNSLLESYFNIDIEVKSLGAEQYQMKKELEIAIIGNTDFADTIFAVAGNIMNMAITNGYVMNLNALDGFNLDASYWDQRIQQEYSIEGMLFTLEGDYTIYDELRTHVVSYNKMLYERFGYDQTYGSLYELVRSGRWTLETMLEMAAGTSDLDQLGDQMSMSSQWGIISESPFPYVVYLGTGNKVIQVEENGNMSYLFDDPGHFSISYDILDYVLGKLVPNKEILVVDASNGVLSSDTNVMWAQSSNMFR